jgi:multiple sugar transport system substrate-binding protein
MEWKGRIIMRNKKMRVGLVSVLALSMISLAGCSSSSKTGADATDTGGVKTITLAVFTSNRYLEFAKEKYEAAHPNVKINIQEFVAAPDFVKSGQAPTGGGNGGNGGGRTGGNQGGQGAQGGQGNVSRALFGGRVDPKEVEKYTTGINTSIMSGKAPDLFATNYLNYDKYAEKKLIANLSDQIKNDSTFDINNYYANILDSTKVNGSIFSIPIRFQLNLMVGDKEALGSTVVDDAKWNWQDFSTIAKSLVKDTNGDGQPETFAFDNMNGPNLLSQMLTTSYQKFVDTANKKANFDSPEFISLLNLAKSMVDSKLVSNDKQDRNTNLFEYSNIRSYEQFLFTPQFQLNGHAEFLLPPSENDNRGVGFSSDLSIALNSKSKVKNEAWDFLKFLLSDDMQSQKELQGFAVNKKASDAHMEQLKTLGTSADKNQLQFKVNGKDVKIQPATQADIDRINQLMSSASIFTERDIHINDTITTESEPFFSGQKTAEDVAKVLQSKINTFLNE